MALAQLLRNAAPILATLLAPRAARGLADVQLVVSERH
jgi:hypothetical protein